MKISILHGNTTRVHCAGKFEHWSVGFFNLILKKIIYLKKYIGKLNIKESENIALITDTTYKTNYTNMIIKGVD